MSLELYIYNKAHVLVYYEILDFSFGHPLEITEIRKILAKFWTLITCMAPSTGRRWRLPRLVHWSTGFSQNQLGIESWFICLCSNGSSGQRRPLPPNQALPPAAVPAPPATGCRCQSSAVAPSQATPSHLGPPRRGTAVARDLLSRKEENHAWRKNNWREVLISSAESTWISEGSRGRFIKCLSLGSSDRKLLDGCFFPRFVKRTSMELF